MIVDAKTYGDIYSALAFSRTIIIRANGEVHCGRMSSIKHTDEGTIVRCLYYGCNNCAFRHLSI